MIQWRFGRVRWATILLRCFAFVLFGLGLVLFRHAYRTWQGAGRGLKAEASWREERRMHVVVGYNRDEIGAVPLGSDENANLTNGEGTRYRSVKLVKKMSPTYFQGQCKFP